MEHVHAMRHPEKSSLCETIGQIELTGSNTQKHSKALKSKYKKINKKNHIFDFFSILSHFAQSVQSAKMCDFDANHFNYRSFTSLSIVGVIEVLEAPKSTKMIQNGPKWAKIDDFTHFSQKITQNHSKSPKNIEK